MSNAATPPTNPSMIALLTGKTVLLTGAARGLGAEIAATCLRRGAELVILTDVLADELEKTTVDLGERARSVLLDVTDERSWAALADHLRATVGRPDVLVNNAGIISPQTVGETTPAAFRRSLDVNLVGPFLGTRLFVALHEELDSPRPGSIVNISSSRGLVGATRASAYSASKFGLRGLTKATATELGPFGIRVNSVCPGPIESEMSIHNPQYADMDWEAYVRRLPIGHLGQPADVGEAVAWLGSDASAFVTGIDLPVDGGLTATTFSPEPRVG